MLFTLTSLFCVKQLWKCFLNMLATYPGGLTAGCDVCDFFSLFLLNYRVHQLKRRWQISSWPLGVHLQRPKREPQLPKRFICRQKLVAQARWGVSCLVQYVLVLLLLYCQFIDFLVAFSCLWWLWTHYKHFHLPTVICFVFLSAF